MNEGFIGGGGYGESLERTFDLGSHDGREWLRVVGDGRLAQLDISSSQRREERDLHSSERASLKEKVSGRAGVVG